MSSRNELAREGAVAALRVRRRLRYSLYEGLCPHDLALKMGLQLRFEAIPSLEGVYCASTPPVIILSSLRPPGRRAFTCAHELGHHVFGHGTHVDQIVDSREQQIAKDPQEYLADRFASEILMPKLAVESGFARRKWKLADCTPENVYIVAGSLGVGYGALVDQMEFTLGSLSTDQASALRRVPPKRIRRDLLGRDVPNDLILFDSHWSRPADLEIGDFIVIPGDFRFVGQALERVERSEDRIVARAVRPGASKVHSADGAWTGSIRVARCSFQGLSQYRFLEDPDYAGG